MQETENGGGGQDTPLVLIVLGHNRLLVLPEICAAMQISDAKFKVKVIVLPGARV